MPLTPLRPHGVWHYFVCFAFTPCLRLLEALETVGQEPSLARIRRWRQTDPLAAAGAFLGSCPWVLGRRYVPSSSILIKRFIWGNLIFSFRIN